MTMRLSWNAFPWYIVQQRSLIMWRVPRTKRPDHTENAQITPSEDTLTAVELSPSEIVKMVQVSDAAQQMSIPVFNAWLSRTLGEAIARKINNKIITAISAAATSAGTTIDAAGVQTLLGSVKGESVSILCNRKTLYNKLLPIQDNANLAL